MVWRAEAAEKTPQGHSCPLFLDMGKHMSDTARLYNCLRCRSQVMICRRCDRGNVYCSKCAPIARRDAENRAAVRYQASAKGRLNHAARQRRYRERLNQKVTHRGSSSCRIQGLLVDKQQKIKTFVRLLELSESTPIVCHSCRELCSSFLRRNYLNSTA